MNLSNLLSIPLHTTVFSSVLAGACEYGLKKKMNIMSWPNISTNSPVVLRWSDYPQSITAGIAALSILGTGGVGCTAFISFTLVHAASKLATKYCQNKKILKIANACDHTLRLGAKVMNTYAAIFIARAQPHSLFNFSMAATSVLILVKDVKNTVDFARSKPPRPRPNSWLRWNLVNY